MYIIIIIFNFHSYIQLLMEIRFLPKLGGNGLRYVIEVMNDTGSNILTLFFEDLNQLGFPQLPYYGWLGKVAITMADGNIENLPSLLVEIKFLRSTTHEPLGPLDHRTSDSATKWAWAYETFWQGDEGCHVFLGTGPGNHHLAVVDTKGGMSAII